MTIFESLENFVSHPRISALTTKHGRTIATVARISQAKDSYVSSLVDISNDRPRTLTRSMKGESLMAIGERGEVYFASGRNDEHGNENAHALWMLPPSGEARVIARTPGEILAVIAAGGKLFITAKTFPKRNAEEAAELAKKRADLGVSAILHEDFPVRYWDSDLGPTYPHLFVADTPDLDDFAAVVPDEPEEELALPKSEIALRPIRLPEGKLSDVHVSADGTRALVTIGRTVKNSTEQVSSVYEIDVETGASREVAVAPRQHSLVADYTSYTAGPYSPDGSQVLVHASSGNMDGDPLRAWIEIAEGGERRRIPADFDDWPSECAWVSNDTLVLSAPRRGRQSLYLVTTAGHANLLTDDDYAYTNIGVRDGAIYALRSAITEPGQPVRVNLDGQVTELTELTPDVHAPGRTENVTTHGTDGTEIRAWLCLPKDTNSPAPLLTFVHGGPWGTWNDWTWRWNPWPFVAKGYAVLLPDPAISTGYGQAMIDRGNDAIGDAPYTDILKLIATTEEREDIDEKRTALLGGSYGGYMANWMAGHTGKRFACIVSHASLWNIAHMAGTTDNGSWYEWMMPSQEAIYSPHRFADQIQVPMLVIHGDKDYRVPISQSHALWQALNRVAHVRGHKFLYYPDENHWILKPSNSMVWYQTVMAFLDHHVLGKEWSKPELLG
ncbi:dipeptidyl aminopeptidase/acylaminoacyl peptidase [Trueperella bonasi]|uniref:Dipeptidyl aminopeptidase/acylaminoacyl peptidase n=1 Tax=Trueperella bonasi TaxID=312286 RepID=A0ABT9NGK8_9ACTO|nr:prolyl oligopeptidase family serine peptidase [Trueperella bonasi]MDP9806541.1 dipeptidyl aminopeptidase/acylaminoacyl peptidase [Trueperella bonasi]